MHRAAAAAKERDDHGRFMAVHGGWTLERAYQRGKVPPWARRLLNRWRFEYALALGYPSWPSTPAPMRTAIDNALRSRLLAERLFAGFWDDQEVPARYDVVSRNLQSQLRDLGLPASQPAPDAAAILAGLRASGERGTPR